ncbi:MAG: DUF1700 domain-containing protein [Mobilitalea sp.]
MDKREFIDTLRQSLIGEVSPEVIEENVRYYDQFINSHVTGEEAHLFAELGDPRLIAKTIIETEKMSKLKDINNGYQGGNTYYNNETEEGENQQDSTNPINPRFFSSMTWYQKVALILIMIVIFIVIFSIGRVVVKFLFAFGLPIILILLILTMFRKR